MRILELIPLPFFSPRGTGYSSYNRTRTVAAKGHIVDIVTVPFGEDVEIDNVTIYRVWQVPFLDNMPMGPSPAKYVYNVLMFFAALRLFFTHKYDCIHVHGESVYFGIVLRFLFGVPLLHDLHGSIPAEYKMYKPNAPRWLVAVLSAMERFAVSHSDVMIVICPALRSVATGLIPEENVVVVENFPLMPDKEPTKEEVLALRRELGVSDDKLLVVYAGSFGANQSLDLLLDSVGPTLAECPEALFLLVGGDVPDVDRFTAEAGRRGVGESVMVIGRKSNEDIWRYLAAADVLVSPRKLGINTPLKVYTYLYAARPIVAVDSLTHTQALDDETALLTPPDAESFARGVVTLLNDPARGEALASRARETVMSRFNYERFAENTLHAFARIEAIGENHR